MHTKMLKSCIKLIVHVYSNIDYVLFLNSNPFPNPDCDHRTTESELLNAAPDFDPIFNCHFCFSMRSFKVDPCGPLGYLLERSNSVLGIVLSIKRRHLV